MDFSVPPPILGSAFDIVHIVQKNMEWNAHLQYCGQFVIVGGERKTSAAGAAAAPSWNAL